MTAKMTARTVLLSLMALLLAFAIPLGAVAELEVKPVSAIHVGAEENKMDVVLFSGVETRVDNLHFSFGDKALKTEKVQHYRSATGGCSYLFMIDMPRMTSESRRAKLLDNYKKTMVYILGSMADEDNAAMMDTSAESIENIRFGERTSFFTQIDEMAYQETPNTLNASISRALDYLGNTANSALRRRTCLVVLTNGFGKDEEGQSTEMLIEKVKKTSTTVYTITYPTSSGKEDEIERMGDVARASKGGCALVCEDSSNESARQLLFTTFSQNESCFYLADVSLEALTSSDAMSTLTLSISAKTDTYADEYTLTSDEQAAVANAVSARADEDAQDEQEEEEEEKDNNMTTILLIGGAILLLIAIVLVVLAISRAKQKAVEVPTAIEDEPTEIPHVLPPIDVNGINRPHIRVTLSQSGLNESARYEADMLDSIIIGRDPKKARLVITNDPKVSGAHAKLTYDGTIMRLEDCNSTNGTRLNGVKITTPCTVQQGDEMTFGRSSLRIHWTKVS